MEKENLKPSYFSILTADIRYDKTLSASEKIFYSEITCLCQADGFCYASNNYFSKLYNCDERTIKRWLKKLCEKKYIKIVYDKITNNRKIYIILKDKLNINQVNKIKTEEIKKNNSTKLKKFFDSIS